MWCSCEWGRVCAMACVWRSGDNTQGWPSPDAAGVLEVELRWSGLHGRCLDGPSHLADSESFKHTFARAFLHLGDSGRTTYVPLSIIYLILYLWVPSFSKKSTSFPFSSFSCFCFVVSLLFFWENVSVCRSGWPGTHPIAQTGLKLKTILLSQFWQVCIRTPTFLGIALSQFISSPPCPLRDWSLEKHPNTSGLEANKNNP